MNRDDIIHMARESELLTTTEKGYQIWMPDNLERFAALVAAAERDIVTLAAFQVAERQVAAEREACAKLAETPMYRHEIAEKIRARGQE